MMTPNHLNHKNNRTIEQSMLWTSNTTASKTVVYCISYIKLHLIGLLVWIMPFLSCDEIFWLASVWTCWCCFACVITGLVLPCRHKQFSCSDVSCFAWRLPVGGTVTTIISYGLVSSCPSSGYCCNQQTHKKRF